MGSKGVPKRDTSGRIWGDTLLFRVVERCCHDPIQKAGDSLEDRHAGSPEKVDLWRDYFVLCSNNERRERVSIPEKVHSRDKAGTPGEGESIDVMEPKTKTSSHEHDAFWSSLFSCVPKRLKMAK